MEKNEGKVTIVIEITPEGMRVGGFPKDLDMCLAIMSQAVAVIVHKFMDAAKRGELGDQRIVRGTTIDPRFLKGGP